MYTVQEIYSDGRLVCEDRVSSERKARTLARHWFASPVREGCCVRVICEGELVLSIE